MTQEEFGRHEMDYLMHIFEKRIRRGRREEEIFNDKSLRRKERKGEIDHFEE